MGGVFQSARIVLGSPSETLELLDQLPLDVLTAPLCVVLLHSVSEHGDALPKELEGSDAGTVRLCIGCLLVQSLQHKPLQAKKGHS